MAAEWRRAPGGTTLISSLPPGSKTNPVPGRKPTSLFVVETPAATQPGRGASPGLFHPSPAATPNITQLQQSPSPLGLVTFSAPLDSPGRFKHIPFGITYLVKH